MRSWIAAGAAVIALGMGTAALAQDVVAQRREGMRAMGRNMEAIKAVLDAHGDTRPLAERVAGMIPPFQQLPNYFPAGSGTGDTRALPAIWSDSATFAQRAATMTTRLEALRVAAASGDLAATQAAFGQVGQGCGACHQTFRGPAR